MEALPVLVGPEVMGKELFGGLWEPDMGAVVVDWASVELAGTSSVVVDIDEDGRLDCGLELDI